MYSAASVFHLKWAVLKGGHCEEFPSFLENALIWVKRVKHGDSSPRRELSKASFLRNAQWHKLVNSKMLLSENYENNYSTEIPIFFVYFERQYLHIFGVCFDQNSSRKWIHVASWNFIQPWVWRLFCLDDGLIFILERLSLFLSIFQQKVKLRHGSAFCRESGKFAF